MPVIGSDFNWINFSDLKYERPDQDNLSDAFRRCRLRLRLAMSAHACIHANEELQITLLNYKSMAAIARIKCELDLTDEFWVEEKAFFDQISAQVETWQQSAYNAIVSSRFRDEIEDAIGPAFFREAERLSLTVQDRVLADLNEESRLESAYSTKLSQIRAVMDNREYTLIELEPMLQERDELVRRHAHTALNNALAAEQGWFDTCLSQLASVRHRMSRKLGYKSFVELGNQRMGRHDYKSEDISRFRDNVIKYLVPVCREIRRLQAVRLGKAELQYWDLPCMLPEGNPKPVLNYEAWPEGVGRVLNELLDDGDFLTPLGNHGYIDCAYRTDKAAGSHCNMIFNARLPFIRISCIGSQSDLVALLHETGHAYAGLASLTPLKILENHVPDYDICEIHGRALEFLSLPLMTEFFENQTELAAMLHMSQTLLSVPYFCLADHFQHRIYEHPEMKSEQRHECWQQLEKLYLPDVDYGDDRYFANGGSWQKIEKIFVEPFSFIDDALAVMASLDLWQTSQKDQARAVSRYRRLCRLGNNGTYLNQLDEAGIASPFDEGTFKRLTYSICDYLSL